MVILAQLTALQAEIIGRLLEPERVPWKASLGGWLVMPITAEHEAAVPAQSQHLLQLGTGLAFSSFPTRASRLRGESWRTWWHAGSCIPTGWSARRNYPSRRSWGSPCSTGGKALTFSSRQPVSIGPVEVCLLGREGSILG